MQTKGKFIFGKNHIATYSKAKYRPLVDITLAMTITKYDITSLYREHIAFVLLATMFFYFRVFDDNYKFIIDPRDVVVVYNEVKETDI